MQYKAHEVEVPPIDFDFSISWCDRVREWTLRAHWLSAISPRNVQTSSPPAYVKVITASTHAALQNVNLFIATPFCELRDDNKFHVHAFVFLAANHGTHHYVFTWLSRRGQPEFLCTRLEQEIPVGHF